MEQTFKTSHLIALGLFLVAVIGVRLFQYRTPHTTIELKGQTLNVMVAETPAQQFRGLGKRDSLAPYGGMLFLFDESDRHAFVMRDMRFPIDIVWFDRGTVVDIASNVAIEPDRPEDQLTRYYPRTEANTVLELSAGWAEKYDLKIGDSLRVIE